MLGSHRSRVNMRAVLTIHTLAAIALLACSSGLCAAAAASPSAEVPGQPDTAAAVVNGAAVPDSVELEEPPAPRPDRIVVYYFHRTLRCDTCLKFEAYTDEALRSYLVEELADGRLVWSVLNVDDESNATLVDAYDIFESSLVVSAVDAGEERSWEKLETIWGLVGDKPSFLSYIQSEVEARLSEVRRPESTHSSVRDSVVQPNKKLIRR